jgi:hemerythrin superfamily protein
MDAIALLKRDHTAVQKLFDRFEALGDEAHARKKHLVLQISRELSIHTGIEERYLYPYAKARNDELVPRWWQRR